ncbi:MAG: site-specific integrase [Acidobacteria bacterium]|nr:site-specific integrase [Acidobacteriota bacterium]
MLKPDGSLGRVLHSEVIGLVSELSKREARNILETRLRPLNEGRQRPQSTITLEQFVREHWEPAVAPTLKAGSAAVYRAYLKRHLLPALGSMRLSEISRPTILALLASKRQQGYSGATLHCIRTALSKVLNEAVECKCVEDNAARGIRVGERRPQTERPYLLAQQVRTLLNGLPEPCRTLVLVAVLTGLRIGELLALRWKRVDFLDGVIQVRETVYEGTFGTPKTRSSKRDVPLSQSVRDALLAHRARSANTELDALVFATRKQTPLNPRNLLNRVLRPACKELGLPAVSWHSFRHTHATLLGEVGESLKTAQAILGHSDLETTLNIYTHAIPDSQRRAVEKVAAILFPNVPKSAVQAETGRAN